MYYDIRILSCIYPIESVRGRYHGGIKVAEWYTPNSKALTPAQMELLERLLVTLEGDDVIVLQSIIDGYSA